MTSQNFLQQLHRLDRSSDEFHDKLSNILYGEEYKQSAPNLDTDCSAWLVDYLDNVRRSISPPRLCLPQRRFSIFSILPPPPSGNVYVNLEACVAPG